MRRDPGGRCGKNTTKLVKVSRCRQKNLQEACTSARGCRRWRPHERIRAAARSKSFNASFFKSPSPSLCISPSFSVKSSSCYKINPFPIRINCINRILHTIHISPHIRILLRQRVHPQPRAHPRVVIPRPVVVQPSLPVERSLRLRSAKRKAPLFIPTLFANSTSIYSKCFNPRFWGIQDRALILAATLAEPNAERPEGTSKGNEGPLYLDP